MRCRIRGVQSTCRGVRDDERRATRFGAPLFSAEAELIVTERRKNSLLLLTTVCLTLLLCEAALRLWHGRPLLELDNRRAATRFDLPGIGRYDSALGWSLKDRVDTPRFHTVEDGIRRNGPAQAGMRPGNILVVGSSFTSGVEVADDESWPAQLETLTGTPVDNAAVPAFALDQIVLRAEQLLPVARPRLLLVGMTRTSIDWTGDALRINPKPYFTVDGGTLRVHNIPVPSPAQALPFEPVISALAYSYLLDRVMARLDPGGWYSRRVRVANDPVDISCRLLQRLKSRADALATRVMLVSEISAQKAQASDRPPPDLAKVEECARATGYRVVATFDAFRRAFAADAARFRSYYVINKSGPLTHYSAVGNRLVAEMVAGALASDARLPVGGER